MPIKIAAQITYKPPIAEWQRFFSAKMINQAMREELNYTGRLARTQLRRTLAKQTLMPYGEVSKAVTMRPAYQGNLSVTLTVKDKVPTLGRFMTSFRTLKGPRRYKRLFMGGMPVGVLGGPMQQMRLRVWKGSQTFPVHSTAPFVLPGTRLIVVRTGKGHRAKLKALSGPNLAGGKPDTGEIQRGEAKQYVQIVLPKEFSDRVFARLQRLLAAKTLP